MIKSKSNRGIRADPKSLISYAVVLLIIMNLTYTYTYAAGILGIPFLLFGLGMLVIFAGYILINADKLQELLRIPLVLGYLILFVVIPIFSVLYAPIFIPRFVGYQVMTGGLFLATIIYIRNEGVNSFAKLILFAWMVSVFGIVVSYFAPGFFANAAALRAEARAGGGFGTGELTIGSARLGRAFGFYLQPNRASYALLLQTVIVTTFLFHSRPFWRYLVLGVTFGTILLTGSRGGVVVFCVVLGVVLLNEMFLGVRGRGGQRKPFMTVIPSYIAFFLIALCAFFGLQQIGILGQSGETAIDRIVEMITGDDLLYDTSVQARLLAQQNYLSGIAESPIIGHGLVSSTYDREVRGLMTHSSHNSFLEAAYEFGVPVALGMYVWMIVLATRRQSKQLRRAMLFDLSWCFCALIFAASLVTGGAFEWRLTPSIMAFWVGAVYFGNVAVASRAYPMPAGPGFQPARFHR